MPTTTSCAGYACDGTTNLCKITCTGDADCLSTFYCDSTGHCAAETKMKGDTCDNTVCYMMGSCRQCLTDNACSTGPGKCP